MADLSKVVPKEKVDQIKRRLLMKFREMLRGAKLSENILRFLSGELGESYRFQTEIVLDETLVKFIEDPSNREKLMQERLE